MCRGKMGLILLIYLLTRLSGDILICVSLNWYVRTETPNMAVFGHRGLGGN